MTATSAVRMLIRLSFGQSAMPDNLLQAKAVKFAEQRQQAGATVVSETANLGALHVYCCAMVTRAGGISKLSELQCREIAILFLRTATPSRAQDPVRMYREAMRLEPAGSSWESADALVYRLYKNKDVNNRTFNRSSARSKFEQQHGEWSSEVRIRQHTEARHLPDYFSILGRYMSLTKKREVLTSASVRSTVNGETRNFAPLLLGAPTRTYADTVLSGQRCSNITLAAMRKSCAVSATSPLKAKHLRHSVMSKVFQWADGHADRRLTWDRALASARHSQVTFYRSYHLRLDGWTLQAISSVPTGASLEDVLMSSAGHTWPDAGN